METIAKINIQKEILDEKHDLVWSYILNYENNENPFNDRKKAINDWEIVAKKYVPFSEEVLIKGKEMELLGIRQKDALHIACAIIENCDYFVTCDKGY